MLLLETEAQLEEMHLSSDGIVLQDTSVPCSLLMHLHTSHKLDVCNQRQGMNSQFPLNNNTTLIDKVYFLRNSPDLLLEDDLAKAHECIIQKG